MRRPQLIDCVLSEIDDLAPWHDLYVQTNEQAATGISGLTVKDAARLLDDILRTGRPQVEDERDWGKALRFAAEDLRSYVCSAAVMRPGGAASSREVADWFWGETSAGALIVALHPVCLASDNASVRLVADTQLVPRAQKHRLAKD